MKITQTLMVTDCILLDARDPMVYRVGASNMADVQVRFISPDELPNGTDIKITIETGK